MTGEPANDKRNAFASASASAAAFAAAAGSNAALADVQGESNTPVHLY